MPKSKTIYETFDGCEYPTEALALEHEKSLRSEGNKKRQELVDLLVSETHFIDSKFIELIRSYSYDDAWKIIRTLENAKNLLPGKFD